MSFSRRVILYTSHWLVMSITSVYFARTSTVKSGTRNLAITEQERRHRKAISSEEQGCIVQETNLESVNIYEMKTRGGKHKASNADNPILQKKVPEKKRRQLQKIIGVNEILPLPVREEGADDGFPKHGPKRLQDDFYDVPCEELAKALLGCILVRRLSDGELLKARIVETECYLGGEDKASFSFGGKVTERNSPMYMKPGTTFVYFTYGMYHCFNISSQGPGAAVLLRALDPIEGMDRMLQERAKFLNKKKKATEKKPLRSHELCNGPGKLCLSFCLERHTCNAQDLCQWGGLWVERDDSVEPFQIVTSTRIGIDSVGGEWIKKPLRFYILSNPSVSRRDKAREKELLDNMSNNS